MTQPASLPAKIAQWPAKWREQFEERAGIVEFQGNVTRELAEARAEKDVRWQYQQSGGR